MTDLRPRRPQSYPSLHSLVWSCEEEAQEGSARAAEGAEEKRGAADATKGHAGRACPLVPAQALRRTPGRAEARQASPFPFASCRRAAPRARSQPGPPGRRRPARSARHRPATGPLGGRVARSLAHSPTRLQPGGPPAPGRALSRGPCPARPPSSCPCCGRPAAEGASGSRAGGAPPGGSGRAPPLAARVPPERRPGPQSLGGAAAAAEDGRQPRARARGRGPCTARLHPREERPEGCGGRRVCCCAGVGAIQPQEGWSAFAKGGRRALPPPGRWGCPAGPRSLGTVAGASPELMRPLGTPVAPPSPAAPAAAPPLPGLLLDHLVDLAHHFDS